MNPFGRSELALQNGAQKSATASVLSTPGPDRPADRSIGLRSSDERSDGSADDEGRNDEPDDDERRNDDEPAGDEERDAEEPDGQQSATDEEHDAVLHHTRSGDTHRLSHSARGHTGRFGQRVRQADHQRRAELSDQVPAAVRPEPDGTCRHRYAEQDRDVRRPTAAAWQPDLQSDLPSHHTACLVQL